MDGDPLVTRALALADRDPDVLLAVVGPTASGKTGLAVALAERLGGEVISADSVQIYRAFDIGSGKPSADERARAPHHLIDLLDPLAPLDAARYAELATRAIDDVRARGKRPIVCGGTFLWVKALVFGLAEAPKASEAVRARHREVAAREGRAGLHAELEAVDPAAAARLHPNDLVRVSRALEVFELTGRPLSARQEEHGFREARHPARLLAIHHTPEQLTERIEVRVETWLRAGWVEEVEALIARGYSDARAMGSVGYREVHAHVLGEIAPDDLKSAIVRATRVFARRQRTWLNRADLTWL